MTHPGNRRIDRVLAVDYLDRLSERPIEDVRQLRQDAEQEEVDLSYLRRLLQGRLDILRAEVARRGGEGKAGSTLVDVLPQILAEEGGTPSPRGLGRHVTAEPSRTDSHRRRVEALVADVDLSDTSKHDDATLGRLMETLQREEADISATRREVQRVMDACTTEIGRRYREGDADIADLLPSESS